MNDQGSHRPRYGLQSPGPVKTMSVCYFTLFNNALSTAQFALHSMDWNVDGIR